MAPRVCPVCGLRHGAASAVCYLVSDAKLANADYLRDVRNFAAKLGIRPSEWLDYILSIFARADVCVVDGRNRPLDAEIEFLPTDDEIDDGHADLIDARIRNWFEETFAASVPDRITPRLRRESRERFRIAASALEIRFPHEATMWGVRPANDNTPLIPPTSRGPRVE